MNKEQIKELRKNKGMTQKDLAMKTGIANSTIAKIENGRFSFSMDVIEPICEVLEVELNLTPIS